MRSSGKDSRLRAILKLRENRSVMAALRLLQASFVLAVIYFLTQKLSDVGWTDVWAALPETPWFYIIMVVLFFAYPIAETIVYQTMWDKKLWPHFNVFIRKRIYNYAVLSYSGEAYMAWWAHKNLLEKNRNDTDLSGRKIVSTIKDSNILSALASNGFTVLGLAAFFFTGQLALMTKADPDYKAYLIVALLVGIILVPAVLHFRRHLISLEVPIAKRVFLVHLTRLVLMLLLQTAQWAVVLPQVPFETWLLFLTAQLVLTRVPFLPNTDLLYAGLGLTMMGYLDAPAATVAGMFLASGVLSQAFNLAAFVLTSLPDFVPKIRKEAQMAKETA